MTNKEEFIALIKLAWPLIIGQILVMCLGIVDMAMVGRLGAEPLAALAIASTLHFSFSIVVIGMLMALDPLVSQAFGAKEHSKCNEWLLVGIILAIFLSIPLMVLFYFSSTPLLTLLKQPTEIIPIATVYLKALIPGTLFRLIYIVGRQYLHAQGKVHVPLIIIIFVNLLNIITNYTLIFGHFGFPALGVLGAGISTSICDTVSAVSLFSIIFSSKAWKTYKPIISSISVKKFKKILSIGAPLGIQFGLEGWGFVFSSFMAGWMGAVILAGHQIALNLGAVTYMVPVGLSSAVAVRVGQAIGRADKDGVKRATRLAIFTGVGFSFIPASLFYLIPGSLIAIYTKDPLVLAVGITVLPVAAWYQIFDALQAVCFGVLRGMGDTRIPALVNMLGFWILGIPFGYWLAFHKGLGPSGIWWGLALGLAVVSLTILSRIIILEKKPLRRVEVL